jgi:hypothetical protein
VNTFGISGGLIPDPESFTCIRKENVKYNANFREEKKIKKIPETERFSIKHFKKQTCTRR